MAKPEHWLFAAFVGYALSACASAHSAGPVQLGSAAAELSCATPGPTVVDAQAVVAKYCVTCHSPSGQASEYDFRSTAAIKAERRNIEAKLRLGAMPPPGVPKPNQADLSALWCWAKAGETAGAPPEYSHAE